MVQPRALLQCRTAMQGVSASLVSSQELRMAFFSRFCRVVPNSPASAISLYCFSSFNKHYFPSPRRSKFLSSVAVLRCSPGLRLDFARPLSSLLSARFYCGSGRDSSHGKDSGNGAKVPAALKGGLSGEDGSVKALDDDPTDGNVMSRPQDGRILHVELHKEVADSYLSYAVSVMVGRALPDVRDGLKPVHRRILFAMHELGLSSRKPFKKCARVVGEVLGKFHPHGDSAVYDALVRMAQDFSLRLPLIRGHGNFGSLDADPPAAMRYTECRLEAVSELMLLADLELDTVDFIPNFDGSQQEPSVLPARLPNLLLNGASGIAVGMATHIPPHNLGEVVDALCALIDNPNATDCDFVEG